MNRAFRRIKLRRGVALFITLSVIAGMLVLVGVVFSYLEVGKREASRTAALIQANLLYRDSVDTINAILTLSGREKGGKEKALEILYAAPLVLQPEESAYFATVSCKPLDNGVNINWLKYENNESEQKKYEMVRETFGRLADQYGIRNADGLYEMIRDDVHGKESGYRERTGRLEKKKGIISLTQFQRIVKTYRFLEDDPSVEEIDWKAFFVFDENAVQIDANYISSEFISLYFGMDLAFVRDEWIEGALSLKTFLSENGVLGEYDKSIFSENPLERMNCMITYGQGEEAYLFGFDYVEGKAERFEFFGKQ